ncbi:putative DMBT1-like protein [Conger conger]|uniref:putative DMBT1-like protein n=1 Tax=Conger conger TaxID=82655 RepID=UPI002A5AD685|nr:putative DMBT1-like protein [Conger conger]
MPWLALLSSLVLWSLVYSRGVRLVGGRASCSGLVEVYYGRAWRRLCSYRWDQTVARLVCQEAGCRAQPSLHYRNGGNRSGVQLLCDGQESRLHRCPWRTLHKPCDTDIGVVCTDPPRSFPGPPVAPAPMRPVSVAFVSLVLCGVAVMAAAVLVVEVVARRRSG